MGRIESSCMLEKGMSLQGRLNTEKKGQDVLKPRDFKPSGRGASWRRRTQQVMGCETENMRIKVDEEFRRYQELRRQSASKQLRVEVAACYTWEGEKTAQESGYKRTTPQGIVLLKVKVKGVAPPSHPQKQSRLAIWSDFDTGDATAFSFALEKSRQAEGLLGAYVFVFQPRRKVRKLLPLPHPEHPRPATWGCCVTLSHGRTCPAKETSFRVKQNFNC